VFQQPVEFFALAGPAEKAGPPMSGHLTATVYDRRMPVDGEGEAVPMAVLAKRLEGDANFF
jgi:hypothetical protein